MECKIENSTTAKLAEEQADNTVADNNTDKQEPDGNNMSAEDSNEAEAGRGDVVAEHDNADRKQLPSNQTLKMN